MNLWPSSWQEIVITCSHESVEIVIIQQRHRRALSSYSTPKQKNVAHRHHGIIVEEHCNGRIQ